MTATATPGAAQPEQGLAALVPLGARRLTAHEIVRMTLRRAVLSGVLPGGTRLVQADIASQLDVSTTPVREALRDLATEGLIQLDAHRGAIVRSIDLDELREVYELRLLLEPVAVRRAVPGTGDDELALAGELVHGMEEAVDNVAWLELNRRFHGLLLRPARRPRLQAIITTLQDSASMYIGLALPRTDAIRGKAEREHRDILEAYRRRDPEAAVRATVQHLEATLAAIEEARRDR